MLQLPRNITFLDLKPFSQNWGGGGRKSNFPPSLGEKLLAYLLLMERKTSGCTLNDVEESRFSTSHPK
jgi:hypothetical protein